MGCTTKLLAWAPRRPAHRRRETPQVRPPSSLRSYAPREATNTRPCFARRGPSPEVTRWPHRACYGTGQLPSGRVEGGAPSLGTRAATLEEGRPAPVACQVAPLSTDLYRLPTAAAASSVGSATCWGYLDRRPHADQAIGWETSAGRLPGRAAARELQRPWPIVQGAGVDATAVPEDRPQEADRPAKRRARQAPLVSRAPQSKDRWPGRGPLRR